MNVSNIQEGNAPYRQKDNVSASHKENVPKSPTRKVMYLSPKECSREQQHCNVLYLIALNYVPESDNECN